MNRRQIVLSFLILIIALSACTTGEKPMSVVSTSLPDIPSKLKSPNPSAIPSLTSFPTLTLAPMSSFIKGITLNFLDQNFDTQETRDVIQQYIIPSGANYVALIPTCWSKDWQDTSIVCSNEADSRLLPPVPDDQLTNVIHYLHSVGLRVILKPQALLMSESIQHQYGTSRGQNWNEQEWQTWFNSYISFITHYAQIAQENHVDLLVVGNEQADTTQRESDWRRVIAAVRGVYSGPITYAANAWQFEASRIKFWDALDYIGTNGYFGYVSDSHPTVDKVIASWKPIVDQLGKLSAQYKKPVLITEIGGTSQQNMLTGKLYWWTNNPYDGQEQEIYYQAFFEAFLGKPWLKGIVLWGINNSLTQGGEGDTGSTFIAKPAEEVVHQYFGGLVLTPTPDVSGLTENNSRSMGIYDDTLENGWKLYIDSNSTVHPDMEATDAHLGTYSIRLPLSQITEVQMYYDTPFINMSQYRWVEFYVKVGKNVPQCLQVVFAYWTPKSYTWSRFVDIDNPKYLQGGQYKSGTWQLVKIPLVDLGITNQVYTELHIGHFYSNCSDISASDVYIDDVRLVASN